MNNPVLKIEDRIYRIRAVQGDEWNGFSDVTFDEAWGRFGLRYKVENGGPITSMGFCYRVTGRKVKDLGNGVSSVRCAIWTPGDCEPDGDPFPATLFMEEV